MFHILGNCIFSIYAFWRGFNGGVVMETLENLKEIVKNAPEGVTIVDIEEDGYLDYLYCDYSAGSGEMIKSCCTDRDAAIEYSQGNIRSLSDIKRIIELMEENKELYEESAKDKGL